MTLLSTVRVALASLIITLGTAEDIDVYFGCGCFWHVQHAFVELEMSALGRTDGSITARAAYAGGNSVGQNGLVCYHNSQGIADYGGLGHAEVVALRIPESKFPEFANKFWSLCPQGVRQDVQDYGGEYRSVIGLPDGFKSSLMTALEAHANGAKLVPGKGNEGDTLNAHEVIVYDTREFPAHVAEKYHQFHNDMVESYGGAYGSLREKFAAQTKCPGDSGSSSSSFGRLFLQSPM